MSKFLKKKILFITTRFPFNANKGDTYRSKYILESLSKFKKIDLVYIGTKEVFSKKGYKNLKIIGSFKIKTIQRILNALFSFIKLKPLQVGYFYSKEMKYFIDNVIDEYDVVVCHTIRSSQYLKKQYKGNALLEMTDLLSLNHKKISKSLSIFNFFKYIYYLESILLKYYENQESKKFKKIILISKNDISGNKCEIFKKKIKVIGPAFKPLKNKFFFSIKNYKIVFIGDMTYHPNILACREFIKNFLPLLKIENNYIELNIIGKISFIDKVIFSLHKNVKVHGNLKNLDKVLKKTICALCNISVFTGFQNKILNYMALGLPTICSYELKKNIGMAKNSVLFFKNPRDFKRKFHYLRKNKNFSENLSKKGSKILNKFFTINKVGKNYLNSIQN